MLKLSKHSNFHSMFRMQKARIPKHMKWVETTYCCRGSIRFSFAAPNAAGYLQYFYQKGRGLCCSSSVMLANCSMLREHWYANTKFICCLSGAAELLLSPGAFRFRRSVSLLHFPVKLRTRRSLGEIGYLNPIVASARSTSFKQRLQQP